MIPQDDFDYITPKIIPRKKTPKKAPKAKHVRMDAPSRYGNASKKDAKKKPITLRYFP